MLHLGQDGQRWHHKVLEIELCDWSVRYFSVEDCLTDVVVKQSLFDESVKLALK